MTQVTDPYARSSWPAPTPQTTSPAELADRKAKIRIRKQLAIGAVIVGLAVAISQGDTKPSGGGKFVVAAGWTVNRVADLEVNIQYDDGVSSTTAACAAKKIAYDHTWLEWQGSPQLTLIRQAESAC
jgi:hypothetical protein